jgi:hypothetical protein
VAFNSTVSVTRSRKLPVVNCSSSWLLVSLDPPPVLLNDIGSRLPVLELVS